MNKTVNKFTSNIKQLLAQKKYRSIFLSTSIVSILVFISLSLLIPYSRFLLLEYFLPAAHLYTALTLFVITVFSLTLGFTISYIAYYFKHILGNRLNFFLGIIGIFYLISFALMLSNTSYSIFSYTEMNGFAYTFINYVLLAPIIVLSSLLLINAYTLIKNVRGGASGGSGLAAGIFSMGCPSCGSLILSLVGVSAGLAIFPLRGLELKILSVGLLIFSTNKLNTCKISSRQKSSPFRGINFKSGFVFSKRIDTIILAVIFLTGSLVIFNQLQIAAISSSFNDGPTGFAVSSIFSNDEKLELSGVDVSGVTSTPMAVATVFPELKNAKSEQDIMAIMLPSGTPEYSEALGGITYDDPVNSLNYLAKWYYSLSADIKENDPDTWERYLNLAAAPRGISCEFCCGVGPQGISEDGKLRCGCKHNPAAQAIALGLMSETDYSDAEILREVMLWKTTFFPKSMIGIGGQVAGQDPSQLKSLPGMVGGC